MILRGKIWYRYIVLLFFCLFLIFVYTYKYGTDEHKYFSKNKFLSPKALNVSKTLTRKTILDYTNSGWFAVMKKDNILNVR